MDDEALPFTLVGMTRELFDDLYVDLPSDNESEDDMDEPNVFIQK